MELTTKAMPIFRKIWNFSGFCVCSFWRSAVYSYVSDKTKLGYPLKVGYSQGFLCG